MAGRTVDTLTSTRRRSLRANDYMVRLRVMTQDAAEPKSKYQLLMDQLNADPNHVQPDDRWTVAPEGGYYVRQPPRPKPDPSMTAAEIAVALGVPEGRAIQACVRAGLTTRIRGHGHPDNTCVADETMLRVSAAKVRELRARWDTGEASELLDITEIAPVLGATVARARNILGEYQLAPIKFGKNNLWFSHQIEALRTDLPLPSDQASGVDVGEVAAALDIKIDRARQIVAKWHHIGLRPSGGAPRKVYDRANLDVEIQKRGRTAEADRLRADFEAALAALNAPDAD